MLFRTGLAMTNKIGFKRIKGFKKKKRRNCKSLKKMSEQHAHSTIFLGNRYDRRRLSFLISLLFDCIQGKPVLYDSSSSQILTPEKITNVSYNAIEKQYYFQIQCVGYHYVLLIISQKLWHELTHLKNKYSDLKYETDDIGNEHLEKRQIGEACLGNI